MAQEESGQRFGGPTPHMYNYNVNTMLCGTKQWDFVKRMKTWGKREPDKDFFFGGGVGCYVWVMSLSCVVLQCLGNYSYGKIITIVFG